MRHHLLLALGGEQLSLTLSQPSQTGWSTRLRNLLVFRQLPLQTGTSHSIASVQLDVALPAVPLTEMLERAWSMLQKKFLQKPKSINLSVQLGLTHARLGLMQLNEEGGSLLKTATIDAYTKAWIQQMWGVDPTTQIIRWDRDPNNSDVLISCIDRTIFDELQAFARRHRIRFVSCKPAVLDALDRARPPPASQQESATGNGSAATIVWTESARSGERASLVQLVHCVEAYPRALWRGWLPPPVTDSASDEALRGAICRFLAANKLPSNTSIEFRCWPQVAQVRALAGGTA